MYLSPVFRLLYSSGGGWVGNFVCDLEVLRALGALGILFLLSSHYLEFAPLFYIFC